MHAPRPKQPKHRHHGLKLALLLGIGAAGVLLARAAPPRIVGNPRVPLPTRPVDLRRYLGRWYELARYDPRFERGCEGVTADYTLRPDGTITVLNTCRHGATNGPRRQARGRAIVVAGSDNARLKVSFLWPFFRADYWILDHDEAYRWAIVGEPSGRYLWLLSRDPTPEVERLALLIGRARSLGYDADLLRMTAQPPGA